MTSETGEAKLVPVLYKESSKLALKMGGRLQFVARPYWFATQLIHLFANCRFYCLSVWNGVLAPWRLWLYWGVYCGS